MATLGTFTNRAPGDINSSLFYAASTAIAPGDLCYVSASDGKVYPASSFTDYGDEASTQRAFASRFAGISAGRQQVTDTTSRRASLSPDREIINFACSSNTFEVGDYLAPVYTAGVLSNQTVTKTTDPTRAIAKVTTRAASAVTTIQGRFTSSLLSGLVLDSAGRASVTAPPAISGSAGSALTYTGGAGFPTTGSTATAGGAASYTGGAGGAATTGTAGAGGAVSAAGGAGGAATTGTAGAGGAGTHSGGAGGTATTGTAGAGGANTVSAGAGGAATGAAGVGGAGGALTSSGGAGGAASDSASGNAGAGGAASYTGGAGGAATGTTTAAGGVGGAWTGSGGAGGTAAGTSAAGAGGAATLSSGAGGAKSGTGAAAGGAGGQLAITAGAGGATANSSTSAGGAGGDVTITAGVGGAASAGTGNGGAGGAIFVRPGLGGATTGGTAGVPGQVLLGTSTGTTAWGFGCARSTLTNSSTATDAQHRSMVFYQDASGGNVGWTTRTGTQLAAAFPDMATGDAIFQFVASNHASNTSTVTGGTDVTLVGSAAVTQIGGTFLLVKTGSTTFDLVRVG